MAGAVVAVTLVVGLLVSYWFFLVGALFYALLVWSSLGDAQENRQVLNETFYPERVRKIDPRKLIGPYRDALARATETRRRIETAVAQTADQGVKRALGDATDDMEELVGTIYDIALKAQSLQASLQAANTDEEALRSDIKRLARIVETTPDDFQRDQYRNTLEGKREQLKNFNDTRDALDRWHSQLDNALNTLDTILSQVLRIRSSEVLNISSETDDVSHTLQDEVEALRATSQAFDAVYGRGRVTSET
jgi:DNA repair exonuclease SbcCD ATPase subunit